MKNIMIGAVALAALSMSGIALADCSADASAYANKALALSEKAGNTPAGMAFAKMYMYFQVLSITSSPSSGYCSGNNCVDNFPADCSLTTANYNTQNVPGNQLYAQYVLPIANKEEGLINSNTPDMNLNKVLYKIVCPYVAGNQPNFANCSLQAAQ